MVKKTIKKPLEAIEGICIELLQMAVFFGGILGGLFFMFWYVFLGTVIYHNNILLILWFIGLIPACMVMKKWMDFTYDKWSDML